MIKGCGGWSKVIPNFPLHLLTTLHVSSLHQPRFAVILQTKFNRLSALCHCQPQTQTVYFPLCSWGGQSWDTRPTEDSKSAVSGHTVYLISPLFCVWHWKVRVLEVTAAYSYDLSLWESLLSEFVFHFWRPVSFYALHGSWVVAGTPHLLQPPLADKWDKSNLHAEVYGWREQHMCVCG